MPPTPIFGLWGGRCPRTPGDGDRAGKAESLIVRDTVYFLYISYMGGLYMLKFSSVTPELNVRIIFIVIRHEPGTCLKHTTSISQDSPRIEHSLPSILNADLPLEGVPPPGSPAEDFQDHQGCHPGCLVWRSWKARRSEWPLSLPQRYPSGTFLQGRSALQSRRFPADSYALQARTAGHLTQDISLNHIGLRSRI